MEILQGLARTMEEAQSTNTSEAFGQLGYNLSKLKDRVREAIQEQTADVIKAVIQKLENNEPLTPEEKGYVRLWVVGDAEGYVKMADTLEQWRTQFRRLLDVIRDYEGKSGSTPEMMNLHGILEDAVLVADNVARFLEDQERIKRFEQAINHLDAADAKFIADILRTNLASPEM